MALWSYLLFAQNGNRCDSVKSIVDSVQNQVNNLLIEKTQAFNKTLDSLHLISTSSISYALKADSCYWQFRKELAAFREVNFEVSKSNQLINQVDSITAEKSQMLDSLFNTGQLSTIDGEIIRKTITIPLNEMNVEPPSDVQLPLHVSSLWISGSSTKTLSVPNKSLPLPGIAAITPNSIMEQTLANNDYGSELKRATMATNNVREKIPRGASISIDSVGSEIRREVVDLFSGREKSVADQLNQTLKLQVKYKTFSDSRLLPRKKPNQMKDKSFLERVMPGLMLQMYQGKNYAVDISPFAAYRFNENLAVGVGWYRRACYFKDSGRIDFVDCNGYRIFSIFNIISGFAIYADVAYGRNRSEPFRPFDVQTTSWRGRCNLGVHKRYKVGQNLYAHSLIAYDLLKIKRFPNTEGSVIRFGIDYQISRKKRTIE